MCTERIRHEVINVVDRYISVEMIEMLNSDAGWRGFGQYCEGSGTGSISNAAMIYQLQMAFDKPNDPRTRWSCKAMKMLRAKSESNHKALVAYVFLRNRPDPVNEVDYFTMERIAESVGLKRKAFHTNLCKAVEFIQDLLELKTLGSGFENAA